MSKRELRALVGAKDPDPPSPEPQAEEEAEGIEEGLAEAARLARVGGEIEEELQRARDSARSLKEAFGVAITERYSAPVLVFEVWNNRLYWNGLARYHPLADKLSARSVGADRRGGSRVGAGVEAGAYG
eukprot:COSAG05_NODE_4284_length_1584_cov_1.119865_2_plen_129_part_00